MRLHDPWNIAAESLKPHTSQQFPSPFGDRFLCLVLCGLFPVRQLLFLDKLHNK
jgi:hypothetical protein